MIHIAIEGMDGVGKTTICELLSQKTGFQFVTKPLHYLTDDNNEEWPNYFRARDIANRSDNKDFSAWFYGLGLIYSYEKFKDKNIITDRHIVSNYCWSGTSSNKDIFDLLIKKLKNPTLTVILYATKEKIIERLKKRDLYDKDLNRVDSSECVYEKMISFCELNHFPYIVIDSSDLTPNEIVEKILEALPNGVL